MNISFAISVAVMLVGAVLYVLPADGKLTEIGRIMFAFGLLVTLLRFVGDASLRLG